jgi:hypothetical protein
MSMHEVIFTERVQAREAEALKYAREMSIAALRPPKRPSRISATWNRGLASLAQLLMRFRNWKLLRRRELPGH